CYFVNDPPYSSSNISTEVAYTRINSNREI
ncbi:uncharacterized protein METZ01_LOCUS225329, partial [marine metagenome]